MKKTITMLVCALTVCALLAGCGGGGGGEKTPAAENTGASGNAAPVQSEAGSKYVFPFKGAQVAVNAPMAPLVDALGEPGDYFESESCAFQGLDKVYTYGSVVIRTYPQDGTDYVLSVQLRDDTVSTGEGVYIGQTRDDVVAAYGETADETDAALRYVDGDCTLTFLLADGAVTDITYTADAV